jgi:hypothetical protein
MQSKQAMRLAGQIPTWIAGKMTACLQIIDTDLAFMLKSFATQVKHEVKTQVQAAAVQAGVEATLKCGAFEILQIIQKSVQMLRGTMVQEHLVLAAARRNGILAWRPDLKAKKLVDCSNAGVVQKSSCMWSLPSIAELLDDRPDEVARCRRCAGGARLELLHSGEDCGGHARFRCSRLCIGGAPGWRR